MKKLIRFALPFLGSALILQLYSTTDLIFAGWFLGSGGVAAIGSTAMIVTILIGVFSGLGVGISTHIARLHGEGNETKIRVAVETSLSLIIVLAIPSVLILEFAAKSLLGLMHVPGEIYEAALIYLRIYSIGGVSIILYNVVTAIMRAMGDSLMPMIAQLIGGVANVAANYIFIVELGLGVAGAGMATLISQSVAAIFTTLFFIRKSKNMGMKKLRLSWSVWDIRQICKVGIPAALQTSIITLSNGMVQANINTLGVVSIAAIAAYFKVENFIYYPIMAVGQANAVIAAQDYGRGNRREMIRGVRRALALGMCVSAGLAVVLIILSRQCFMLFGNDEQVILVGMQMVKYSFPFYFLYLIMEILSGTVRSTGDALGPMICIVINMCPVRLTILHLLMKYMIYPPEFIVLYPITWITTVLSLVVVYGCWKRKRIGDVSIHE